MLLTEIRLDKADRKIIVASHDDVEDILEHNKTLRTMPQKSDWGRHIASIPPVICVKWLNEERNRGHNIRFLSAEWDEIVAKKLKDPDWFYLRTDMPNHVIGYRK